MSNPNTATVFDPNGDVFEMSKANARDLVEHAGWSFSKPIMIEKIVEVPVKHTTPETPAKEEAEQEEAAEEAAEEEATDDDVEEAVEEAAEEEAETEADTAVTLEDFADIEDRDAAVKYLAENFPDFKPHHKAGRDSLVEKIVELSNA